MCAHAHYIKDTVLRYVFNTVTCNQNDEDFLLSTEAVLRLVDLFESYLHISYPVALGHRFLIVTLNIAKISFMHA